MLVHFKTRDKARQYALLGSKVVDKGVTSPVGKRWACEAVIAPKGKSASVVPRETIKIIPPKADNVLQCVAIGLEDSLEEWRKLRKAAPKLKPQDLFTH